MRSRSWVTFLICLALLLSAAQPAVGKPKPRETGPLPSAPISDGSRYAVWTDGDYVRIKDPAARSSSLVEVPTDCMLRDVGGGQLLFSCRRRSSDSCDRYAPLLYSIADHAFHEPVGIEDFLGQQGDTDVHGHCVQAYLAAVGGYWIEYRFGGRDSTTRFLNWSTGEEGYSRETRSAADDLDALDLLTEICPPLERADNPYVEDPDDEPYLEQPVAGTFSVHAEASPPDVRDRALYLQRCGSNKRRLLTRQTRTWGLARRAVYWVRVDPLSYIRYLHIRILRSGRRFRYAFGAFDLAVAATRTRLFVDPVGDTHGYVIRTPRR